MQSTRYFQLVKRRSVGFFLKYFESFDARSILSRLDISTGVTSTLLLGFTDLTWRGTTLLLESVTKTRTEIFLL